MRPRTGLLVAIAILLPLLATGCLEEEPLKDQDYSVEVQGIQPVYADKQPHILLNYTVRRNTEGEPDSYLVMLERRSTEVQPGTGSILLGPYPELPEEPKLSIFHGRSPTEENLIYSSRESINTTGFDQPYRIDLEPELRFVLNRTGPHILASGTAENTHNLRDEREPFLLLLGHDATEIHETRTGFGVGPITSIEESYQVRIVNRWNTSPRPGGQYYSYRLDSIIYNQTHSVNLTQEHLGARRVESSQQQENPWPTDEITIHVDRSTIPQGRETEYVEKVREAADWWEAGGNDRLDYSPTLRFVNSSDDAHVVVSFVDDLETSNTVQERLGLEESLSYTYTYRGEERIVFGHSNISIDNPEFLNDPEDGVHTLKHELGHALGLGHVPKSEARDVMNPEVVLR